MFWNMEWMKWLSSRGEKYKEKSKVKIEIREKGSNTCVEEKKREKNNKEMCG